MVISLFEGVETAGLPVDLIAPAGRGVELLEFHAEGEARGGAVAPEEVTEVSTEVKGDQTRSMIEAAREEARAEMWGEFADEMERRLGVERARVEQIAREFARDRERYFAAAETQVVRLALAVARRVLQREVQADAMHLQATVRAALARVEGDGRTALKVCADEVAGWQELLGEEVSVETGRGMAAGECVLETNVGRVELGVEVQLGEIERGFVELMERR